MCVWLGLEHSRLTRACLWYISWRTLLFPAPGLAASGQRRARDLQCIAQPVLTRMVPQPQGIGAVTCINRETAAEPDTIRLFLL